MAADSGNRARGMAARIPCARAAGAGFSLLELVVVLVLIGIIGAIAIPRLSRGAAGANEAALTGDLSTLRRAVELYAAEHGGAYPSLADIDKQLTQYTDAAGNCHGDADTKHIYGPYLREIPALPSGANRGARKIAGASGAGVAWIYNPLTGAIRANEGKAGAEAEGVPEAIDLSAGS